MISQVETENTLWRDYDIADNALAQDVVVVEKTKGKRRRASSRHNQRMKVDFPFENEKKKSFF